MITRPENYTVLHIHSELSSGTTNIDSITHPDEYVQAAKDCGMKALGFSEHGNIFFWKHKKDSIEAAGMKYIHGVEAYLTSTLDEKIKDNYHCILIARNEAGVHELNKLVSRSFNRADDNHFYYVPRILFDELFATSDNIFVTTACLGGALHNAPSELKESMLGFLRKNKHRCYLEIQHHNCKEQIEYNQMLYRISEETGIPLIAGTDTHALSVDHMDGRRIMQKSKGISFDNEDAWDLVFKTCDQLIEAYEKQNSLPMEVVYEAIENTNRLADMIEPFVLDCSPKYPKLYEDSDSVFKKKINEGVVRRGIMKYPNYDKYLGRIRSEYDTYKHNNAIDFMLLEEDYKSEMRRRGIKFGYSRGSVSGSIIAYLLGITEVDSVKYNLNFERFMNKERVSLADIDTDWLSEDRKKVKEYLYQKKGLYCCDIVTFNTIALKGAIKDVCRGMFRDNLDRLPEDVKREVDAWDKAQREKTKGNGVGYTMKPEPYPAELVKKIKKYSVHKEVPYDYLRFSDEVIALAESDEEAARRKYPEVFKYVDMVNGVVVSVGNHPAGCVVSPFPVDEWFGTFTTSTDEYPISMLNMKEIDALNFVKLDILGLDNIGLIYKTCELAGIPFLTPDNTPPDDENVWRSIRDDTTMIFQWESKSATAYLRQLMSDETIASIRSKNPDFSYMDLFSIGNGAIRPAGESYRDKLAQGIYQDNGHEALNKFLEPTLGYLVYQEQIIEFLHSFCGYTMGEADIVRRGFAKKTGTEKFIPKIKSGFIKTMRERYGVKQDEAERLIVNFIKVIEDASAYLFSKNHSDPYSWIGYICGYLRYYYPLQFITTALNIFESKEDKSIAIIEYAKHNGIAISPIKFRHSTANYNFDERSNSIFKGIASIKYMNSEVADELYALRDKQYENFMELLFDINRNTSLNTRQISILIDLDFFDEFGDENYLSAIFDVYAAMSGRSQYRKDDLVKMRVPLDIVRPFAAKETEKMFTGVDNEKMLICCTPYITYKKRTLSEKISAQTKHLGYISVMGEQYAGMLVVLDVDTKYSPRVKMYSLRNGTTLDFKISKQVYNKCKIAKGDIVRMISSETRPKVRRMEDGTYQELPNEVERWAIKYKKLDEI